MRDATATCPAAVRTGLKGCGLRGRPEHRAVWGSMHRFRRTHVLKSDVARARRPTPLCRTRPANRWSDGHVRTAHQAHEDWLLERQHLEARELSHRHVRCSWWQPCATVVSGQVEHITKFLSSTPRKCSACMALAAASDGQLASAAGCRRPPIAAPCLCRSANAHQTAAYPANNTAAAAAAAAAPPPSSQRPASVALHDADSVPFAADPSCVAGRSAGLGRGCRGGGGRREHRQVARAHRAVRA